ncbi:MAG: (2Fe-2S)-binding protein [Mycobacterium sp.]
MYVCLCTGATSHEVTAAVSRGASTCKEVARACGAGSDCGRCRRSVRAIIDSGAGCWKGAEPLPVSEPTWGR